MPKMTDVFGLIQPEEHEKYDINVQNENMAKIEDALVEMKENNEVVNKNIDNLNSSKVNKLSIPFTKMTSKSTKVNFNNSDSSFGYSVKNGICTVDIWSINILEACSVEVIANNFPLPDRKVAQPIFSPSNGIIGMAWIGATGYLQINATAAAAGKNGYCSIVYPIAD